MRALCAIDGSAGSDAAVRLIGQLLASGRDELVLYYAPPEIRLRGVSATSHEAVQLASEALVERVFEHARGIVPKQLAERTTTIVGRQRPRVGIPAAAQQHRVDLVAVGARGTSRFGLPRLGSVSRAVVHSVEVPVLVARERKQPASEPLQILLCCAEADLGGEIGSFLQQLSVPENAVGRVLHVRESLFGEGVPEWLEEQARNSDDDPIAKAFVEEHDEEMEESRRQILAQCGKLPIAFQGHAPVVLEGHPGTRITKFVEREKIDLVVMGARMLSPLTRMFAGSTSGYVLAHSASSILVVPHHDAP